ncbi:MAG: AhpC/TSA family protein [Bacteroidales bacterium]|nr:AhpC/TSA family protein [Bacteroidales bacterium]
MKKLLLIALPLLVLSCGRDYFRIEGKYSVADGKTVYLIDLGLNDTLGVTEVKDSSFLFLGDWDKEPSYVYVGNGKERVRFIMEKGTVNVDIDERTVSGTPMVDAYNDFHKRFYSFDAKRNTDRKALSEKASVMDPDTFNAEWEELDRKYASLQADLADSLIRLNPDNLLGAMALEDLSYKDFSRFMELYEITSEEVKSFPAVASRYKSLAPMERTSPGKMFTDYTVPSGNMDGTPAHLSEYIGKGKYILLDHWASWCGPCKAEMPYLKKTYEAFRGDRFDILGIAINDKKENTLKAIEELSLPWNQIFNATDQPSEFYGINAIPHLILFAPDGTIVARGIRGEQIYVLVSKELAGQQDSQMK